MAFIPNYKVKFFTAITYLDKARVWGKQLRVGSSKHQMIQMPKEGQSVSIVKISLTNS